MTAILSPFSAPATVTVSPSGDTSGVTDAKTINAAVAKLPATGGVIALAPSKTWNILCGQISINQSGVYINASGCYILAVGAGDVIRMYDSSTYNSRTIWGGGLLGWPVIDGVNTTGNSAGLHIGDIFQVKVQALFQNFTAGTTSKGCWFDNQYFQTELIISQISARSCTTGVMFDNSTGTSLSASANGSFDRLQCSIYVESNGVGDGVTFANGGFCVEGQLSIFGNFSTSTTQYAVLKLTGSNVPNGASNYSFGYLFMGVELDDAVHTAPYTIFFGAGANSIFKCSGFLDFSQASTFKQTNAAGNMLFSGPAFGDPNLVSLVALGSPVFAQAITGNGQTIFTAYLQANAISGTGGFTGLILSAGGLDGQTTTVINTTAGSLTFAAAGTSHVADGAASPIATLTARTFTWSAAASLWYRSA